MKNLTIFEKLEKNNNCLAPLKRGIVKVSGKDAQSFIQRMSTNDLSIIKPKIGIQTSFVSNKGRLIDHAVVFKSDQDLILISSHNSAKVLIDWLEQYHFVEDLSLTDQTSTFYVYMIIYAETETHKLEQNPFVLKLGDLKIQNQKFLIDLVLLKEKIDCTLNEEELNTLRIAALIPFFPHEINDKFMPQEVGLKKFIAHNKGCYLGQEVISKALTYQKNKKFLVGIMLDEKVLRQNVKGSMVFSKTQNMKGIITSNATTFIPGIINALAIKSSKETTISSLPPDTLVVDRFIF